MTASELDHLYYIIPRGRANACSVADLAYDLCGSDRYVRDLIKTLIEERHVPIVTGTGSKSVFVAETPEELDEALAHINSRAMSLLKRKRALRLCRESLAWRPELFPEV